jgi:hypothetical protein
MSEEPEGGKFVTCRKKATANGVIRDALHRFYRGVLYFHDVKAFHGKQVNVRVI